MLDIPGKDGFYRRDEPLVRACDIGEIEAQDPRCAPHLPDVVLGVKRAAGEGLRHGRQEISFRLILPVRAHRSFPVLLPWKISSCILSMIFFAVSLTCRRV